MLAVPSWAINKNWPVVMAINEARTPTLGLNHFLKIRIMPITDRKANISDGNLIVNIVTPKKLNAACCKK